MDKFKIKKNTNIKNEQDNFNVSNVSKVVVTTPTQSVSINTIDNEETVHTGGCDIGNYIDKIDEINDYINHEILENHWKPGKNYEFPFSVHVKRNREEKRRPNHQHLLNYSWLIFSDVKKGLFCKYCAIFMSNRLVSFNNSIRVKNLIKEPLTKFSKLTGKDKILESHAHTDYHKLAFQKCKDFLSIYKNP